MASFDVKGRTILLVRHGSHAYGLSTPTSDLDVKGVCVPPKESFFGFTQNFEQHIREAAKGNEHDLVVYSLKKFALLASQCNPNIVEVLHVDDSDILEMDGFGERLRAARNTFVSRQVRGSFLGYAHSQIKRIKTHRGWLLNPPKAPPARADFGLSESRVVSKSELGAFDSLFDLPAVDDDATSAERVDQIAQTARVVLNVELPQDVITLFTREKAYRAAMAHWEQYLNWKKTRNPARAELERQFGYDTKHGMHLIRLLRMCREMLTAGQVTVRRPDREELLEIRNGSWDFDRLMFEADRLDSQCGAIVETSPLPVTTDQAKIDELVVTLTEDYLRMYG